MPEDDFAADVGLVGALTIGVGTMIGAGIFLLPSVAAERAGAQLPIVFALGGAVALVNALTVSELGASMPASGGAFYWVDRALGPLFGTIAGLSDWLGLAVASAFYAVGFGTYAGHVLAVPTLSLGGIALAPAQAIGIALAVAAVGGNYFGGRETGRLQAALVGLLVAALAALVAVGAVRGGANAGASAVPVGPFGARAAVDATALIFVSYLGYAKVATVGAELRDRERTLPRAVIGSVVLVTLLYVGVAATVVDAGALAPTASDLPAVLAASDALLGAGGVLAVAVAGLLATATSANLSVLSTARIGFAMGRDGLVSDWLNHVHPRFATPHRSLQLTGLAIVGSVLLFEPVTLALLAVALHLVVYALANLALLVVRTIGGAEYDPGFATPLFPAVPVAGAAFSVGLLAVLPWRVLAATGAVVAGAACWYAAYGHPRVDREGLLTEHLLGRATEVPRPAVAAARAIRPGGAEYRVLLPLANPETARDLATAACGLAADRDGTVVAAHVVEVPEQVPLERAPEFADAVEDPELSAELLSTARETADERGVAVETHVIYSHRTLETVFAAAREGRVDALVMGWWDREPSVGGRAETAVEELARDLPCDAFVLRDRGFDPSEVVVPTAGGAHDDLAASAARRFRDAFDAEVTLLHVVDGESQRGGGERFLDDWAERTDLASASRVVDASGDVEAAIERAADEHTLLVLGASERGLLARLVRSSLVYDVVGDVDCSVLLVERAEERSPLDRLFGR